MRLSTCSYLFILFCRVPIQAIWPFLYCVSVFFLLIGKGSLFMMDMIFLLLDVYIAVLRIVKVWPGNLYTQLCYHSHVKASLKHFQIYKNSNFLQMNQINNGLGKLYMWWDTKCIQMWSLLLNNCDNCFSKTRVIYLLIFEIVLYQISLW